MAYAVRKDDSYEFYDDAGNLLDQPDIGAVSYNDADNTFTLNEFEFNEDGQPIPKGEPSYVTKGDIKNIFGDRTHDVLNELTDMPDGFYPDSDNSDNMVLYYGSEPITNDLYDADTIDAFKDQVRKNIHYDAPSGNFIYNEKVIPEAALEVLADGRDGRDPYQWAIDKITESGKDLTGTDNPNEEPSDEDLPPVNGDDKKFITELAQQQQQQQKQQQEAEANAKATSAANNFSQNLTNLDAYFDSHPEIDVPIEVRNELKDLIKLDLANNVDFKDAIKSEINNNPAFVDNNNMMNQVHTGDMEIGDVQAQIGDVQSVLNANLADAVKVDNENVNTFKDLCNVDLNHLVSCNPQTDVTVNPEFNNNNDNKNTNEIDVLTKNITDIRSDPNIDTNIKNDLSHLLTVLNNPSNTNQNALSNYLKSGDLNNQIQQHLEAGDSSAAIGDIQTALNADFGGAIKSEIKNEFSHLIDFKPNIDVSAENRIDPTISPEMSSVSNSNTGPSQSAASASGGSGGTVSGVTAQGSTTTTNIHFDPSMFSGAQSNASAQSNADAQAASDAKFDMLIKLLAANGIVVDVKAGTVEVTQPEPKEDPETPSDEPKEDPETPSDEPKEDPETPSDGVHADEDTVAVNVKKLEDSFKGTPTEINKEAKITGDDFDKFEKTDKTITIGDTSMKMDDYNATLSKNAERYATLMKLQEYRFSLTDEDLAFLRDHKKSLVFTDDQLKNAPNECMDFIKEQEKGRWDAMSVLNDKETLSKYAKDLEAIATKDEHGNLNPCLDKENKALYVGDEGVLYLKYALDQVGVRTDFNTETLDNAVETATNDLPDSEKVKTNLIGERGSWEAKKLPTGHFDDMSKMYNVADKTILIGKNGSEAKVTFDELHESVESTYNELSHREESVKNAYGDPARGATHSVSIYFTDDQLKGVDSEIIEQIVNEERKVIGDDKYASLMKLQNEDSSLDKDALKERIAAVAEPDKEYSVSYIKRESNSLGDTYTNEGPVSTPEEANAYAHDRAVAYVSEYVNTGSIPKDHSYSYIYTDDEFMAMPEEERTECKKIETGILADVIENRTDSKNRAKMDNLYDSFKTNDGKTATEMKGYAFNFEDLNTILEHDDDTAKKVYGDFSDQLKNAQYISKIDIDRDLDGMSPDVKAAVQTFKDTHTHSYLVDDETYSKFSDEEKKALKTFEDNALDSIKGHNEKDTVRITEWETKNAIHSMRSDFTNDMIHDGDVHVYFPHGTDVTALLQKAFNDENLVVNFETHDNVFRDYESGVYKEEKVATQKAAAEKAFDGVADEKTNDQQQTIGASM